MPAAYCARFSERARIETADSLGSQYIPVIALAFRSERGLKHLHREDKQLAYRLRSLFGASEDWNKYFRY